MSTKSFLILGLLVLGVLWVSDPAFAHDGKLFKDEITDLEKLITGGFMRIGLLVVCAMVAIVGVIKNNGWMLISGAGGFAFVYFMKKWILKTFTLVI